MRTLPTHARTTRAPPAAPPPRPQARGALEQLASALLEQLRSTPNGSASLSALQQAIADATSIDASAPQLREALDQLKAEHAVIERGATISLVG